MFPYPNNIPNNLMPTYPQVYQQQSQQLIKVNGLDSAKAYPTQPNSVVALFDANDDLMYIKSTDASNFPTIRKFRFIEETELKVITPEYVTVEEFRKFKEEILNGKQSVHSQPTNSQNKGNGGNVKKQQ